jgi:hypothetical protein
MTNLLTAFILTVVFYTPVGSVKHAEVGDSYKTAAECEVARAAVLAEPPVGLPPLVGLVCVEVQMPVTRL